MKVRIFNEDDAGSSAGAASGMSCDGCGGANLSIGSNVVNYGPNNPHFSNLAEYMRRKKNKRDDIYESDESKESSKKAGHKSKKKGHSNSSYEEDSFHKPKGW